MGKSQNLFIYRKTKVPVQLECSLNLTRLFPTSHERNRFEAKWPAFLDSDPLNHHVYELNGDFLLYRTEQLIPAKWDRRAPVLLVFGNPATHSVEAGMFFAFKENGKENRFWKNLLRPAGILDIALDDGPPAMLNKRRMKRIMELDYASPFRIGLCVFISMPSTPGGSWSGVAGIRKLLGSKPMSQLESAERERIIRYARKFLEPGGVAVAFQRNAWEGLKSEDDPSYSIDLARRGKLKGSLAGTTDVPLFGVPPTRLIGPCRRILRQLLLEEK
jgi:hypothetical protein